MSAAVIVAPSATGDSAVRGHNDDDDTTEAWEAFLRERYPPSPPTATPNQNQKQQQQNQKQYMPRPMVENEHENGKDEKDDDATTTMTKRLFRDYEANARPTVREFYRVNHERQTLQFVLQQKAKYDVGQHRRREMGIWEAMEFLNTLVDESDPDTDLTQIQHLLQTAESLRAARLPRWMILTGLIHDLGKILTLFGEPQWAVVGDTFPVGCAYAPEVVFSQFFARNPDFKDATLMTPYGIYAPHCGFNSVHMSYGHDEYLYHVVKDYLPREALYIIRFHSFYAAHRENCYQHLMSDEDHEMMKYLRQFNPHDLYSKGHAPPDVEALKPFYMELIGEYFPEKLSW